MLCSALQECLHGACCILTLQLPALALPSSPAQEELCPHSTGLIHLQGRAQDDLGQGGVDARAETPGHSGQLVQQTGSPKPRSLAGCKSN